MKQRVVIPYRKVLIPANLDFYKLVNKYPLNLTSPYLRSPSRVIDNMVVFISQINKRVAFKSDLSLAASGGYVSLHSAVLKKIVPHYKEYTSWLIDIGVIECDGIWAKSKKSLGYRLAEPYASCRKRVEYPVLSPKFVQPFNTASLGTNEKLLLKDLQDTRIEYKKIKKDLTFWREAKSKARAELESDILKCKNSSLYKGLTKQKLQKYVVSIARVKYNAWIDAAFRLHEKQWNFKRDTTSERLHTNLTGLKKELRQYLTIDGEKLVACDLKNSQPFMSLALLNPSLPKSINTVMMYQIAPLALSHPKEYKQLMGLLTSIQRSPPIDVVSYTSSVVAGTLYEDLAIMWSKALNITMSRKTAKTRLFKIFFQPPSFVDKYKKEFAKNYPTIWKMISLANSGFIRVGTGKNIFARLLQNIESQIFIDEVTSTLKQHLPFIPILTIHDSIVTLPKYYEIVEMVLEAELGFAIGYKPTLQKEVW